MRIPLVPDLLIHIANQEPLEEDPRLGQLCIVCNEEQRLVRIVNAIDCIVNVAREDVSVNEACQDIHDCLESRGHGHICRAGTLACKVLHQLSLQWRPVVMGAHGTAEVLGQRCFLGIRPHLTDVVLRLVSGWQELVQIPVGISDNLAGGLERDTRLHALLGREEAAADQHRYLYSSALCHICHSKLHFVCRLTCSCDSCESC